MATETNLPFCWEQVDKLSDLRRFELVLDTLPDTEIINALEQMRGNGRNEYPVAAMWRALVAGIVFGHESVESSYGSLTATHRCFVRVDFPPCLCKAAQGTELNRVKAGPGL